MTARQHTWPFRQSDKEWADEPMWKRTAVIDAHTTGNGVTAESAANLLREFPDGNTIANEGCLITCLAMVLHRLDDPGRRRKWTPLSVNAAAIDALYYSYAGVSMVPLYADLVTELSCGNVQLCAKEEYLSGERDWPPTFASECWLVRGYRAMSVTNRRHFMLMLKIGTYDDSVASHYVLLNPDRPGAPCDDNPEILDPAMPEGEHKSWRIDDSVKTIRKDAKIRRELDAAQIAPMQLCGAWLFGRWRSGRDRMLMEPFVKALIQEWAS